MRALLLHPKFPPSYWSFEGLLDIIGKKTFIPPLSLITVAALLPKEWDIRLVDFNAKDITESDWEWADIVLVSGMIVQRDHMLSLIKESKSRGKQVAAGGPYITSVPEDAIDAGADFLVLDEGEITIPPFVEAVERGDKSGVFKANGEWADMTKSPIPRFDLLDMDLYCEMGVQFSRGCPYLCEFCDIITLYGRKPRTKTPEQIISELQTMYDLGWRRSMFLVDDNFIGNKPKVKPLLHKLIEWQKEHDYPFAISTEASLNLGEDDEMLELMRQANFCAVLLGIETPDSDTLSLTKKTQNLRRPLIDQIDAINKSGLRVMGTFIIGFDGEKSGAGQRIAEFVEQAAIPNAMVNILHALPATDLTQRLQREGRMVTEKGHGTIHQGSLSNFVPTRPLRELAAEHVASNYEIYEPKNFLSRAYRHCANLRPRPQKKKTPLPEWGEIKALFVVLWRHGVVRTARGDFWSALYRLSKIHFQSVRAFLISCAHYEHFYQYRNQIKRDIEAEVARMSDEELDRFFDPEMISAKPMKKPKQPKLGSAKVVFTPERV